MSRNRTMRRFAVPTAIATGALTVAGGIGIVLANADELPDKSAEELFAAVQNSDVQGLSGTVEQSANLGLPEFGTDSGDLASLSSGSHTLGVWYSANDKIRVALQNEVQETDVIRDGTDVYTWNSQTGEARHQKLSEPLASMPLWSPSQWSSTPAAAAEQAVGNAPNTELETDGTEVVAGRDAYGLIMSPTDGASMVDHVRLAVDAETGVPLSTQVFSVEDAEAPAFEVTFSDVSFDEPDAANFEFTAPEGATVEEGGIAGVPGASDETVNLGHDWTSIGASPVTEEELVEALADQGADPEAVRNYLAELPQVDNGRILESTLFTAYLTDDGWLYYGGVTPDALLEAAAGHE